MISTIFNLKISYIDIIDNNGKPIGKSIIDIDESFGYADEI